MYSLSSEKQQIRIERWIATWLLTGLFGGATGSILWDEQHLSARLVWTVKHEDDADASAILPTEVNQEKSVPKSCKNKISVLCRLERTEIAHSTQTLSIRCSIKSKLEVIIFFKQNPWSRTFKINEQSQVGIEIQTIFSQMDLSPGWQAHC